MSRAFFSARRRTVRAGAPALPRMSLSNMGRMAMSILRMSILRFAALLSFPCIVLAAPADFDAKTAERFAKLALACVHKEYPNKISHVLNSDADVAPPRKLTPAFCGCYDWHSSVHGHWLLVRLQRTFPDAPFATPARTALKQSLSPEHLKQEAAYISAKGRDTFERPYGLSW